MTEVTKDTISTWPSVPVRCANGSHSRPQGCRSRAGRDRAVRQDDGKPPPDSSTF